MTKLIGYFVVAMCLSKYWCLVIYLLLILFFLFLDLGHEVQSGLRHDI